MTGNIGSDHKISYIGTKSHGCWYIILKEKKNPSDLAIIG